MTQQQMVSKTDSDDELAFATGGSFSNDDSTDCDYDDKERPYIAGCFEGPEKTLEICFKPGIGSPRGCRDLTREQLDVICRRARCTIINKTSNSLIDAYVLSESSLFVYQYKMILKTCGTTTLLRCIAALLKYSQQLGMELEWLGYSRKNFNFPGDQFFPHSSFDQELAFLQSHTKLCEKLGGTGHILGPMTGDHWFVYVADKCVRPSYECLDRTINIMMFDLHPSVAKIFFKENTSTAREMTDSSGIGALVAGAEVDDVAFEPCGYSMNAILGGNYSTVHITPEAECSYASFETNTPLKDFSSLIENVLAVFRPSRFVLTMMADAAAVKDVKSPFESATWSSCLNKKSDLYVRTSASTTLIGSDFHCLMGNWVLEDTPDVA